VSLLFIVGTLQATPHFLDDASSKGENMLIALAWVVGRLAVSVAFAVALFRKLRRMSKPQ
jgi:hypothetical protein